MIKLFHCDFSGRAPLILFSPPFFETEGDSLFVPVVHLPGRAPPPQPPPPPPPPTPPPPRGSYSPSGDRLPGSRSIVKSFICCGLPLYPPFCLQTAFFPPRVSFTVPRPASDVPSSDSLFEDSSLADFPGVFSFQRKESPIPPRDTLGMPSTFFFFIASSFPDERSSVCSFLLFAGAARRQEVLPLIFFKGSPPYGPPLPLFPAN